MDEDAWHVVPENDLRDHDTSPNCWCHPAKDEDAEGDLYIHNSLDGREFYENGERMVH